MLSRILRRAAAGLRQTRRLSACIVNETDIRVQLTPASAATTTGTATAAAAAAAAEAAAEPAAALTFPAVWLRDNCRCPACFHADSQSRQLDWNRFDPEVRPVAIHLDAEQRLVHIRWSDEHESSFAFDWLQRRSFDGRRQKEYIGEFYRPATRHWAGAQFEEIVQRFSYDQVIAEDEALHKWLHALAVYGVAMISGAAHDKAVVRRLAERVGFIRRTTYGEEFVVQAKPGAQNYAYLSLPLPLHTDLPYYEYKPGVNILHCLVQSKSPGGANLLVDAYHIADRLRSEHPADFERLCRTPVDWNDIGSENGRQFHNIWRAPVICLDTAGGYTRINHSVPQRDSHFNVPLDEVLPWYRSYARFVQLARSDAHTFKTQPGDVLTFNNIRMLHGRTGYDDTADNSRYIVGAYLDWDIIYSRLRVLRKRLGSSNCSEAPLISPSSCTV